MLSRKLGHGICNFGPHSGNGFRGQTLQQLCANCLSLGLLQGKEQVGGASVL
jgi:hypothetical protein